MYYTLQFRDIVSLYNPVFLCHFVCIQLNINNGFHESSSAVFNCLH